MQGLANGLLILRVLDGVPLKGFVCGVLEVVLQGLQGRLRGKATACEAVVPENCLWISITSCRGRL